MDEVSDKDTCAEVFFMGGLVFSELGCVRGLIAPSLSVCRLLQEQMDQSLSDTQRILSVKMNELRAAYEQIEKLEIRIGEYVRILCTVGAVLDVFSFVAS